MVDKKRSNLKKHDKNKILSAMGEVKNAIDEKSPLTVKNNIDKLNYSEKTLILEDILKEDILILDEVYESSKEQKTINNLSLKHNISDLIRPDIEFWMDENICIICKKYVRNILHTNINLQKAMR